MHTTSDSSLLHAAQPTWQERLRTLMYFGLPHGNRMSQLPTDGSALISLFAEIHSISNARMAIWANRQNGELSDEDLDTLEKLCASGAVFEMLNGVATLTERAIRTIESIQRNQDTPDNKVEAIRQVVTDAITTVTHYPLEHSPIRCQMLDDLCEHMRRELNQVA